MELAEANAKLEDANVTLVSVQAKVAELNAMVAELEKQFKVRVCWRRGRLRPPHRSRLWHVVGEPGGMQQLE